MEAYMKKAVSNMVMILMIILLAMPTSVMAQGVAKAPLAPTATLTFTIMHTNDFHGQLEPVLSSTPGVWSNPGISRLSKLVKDTRTAVGANQFLMLDAGDEMQGSLLSNLQKGQPTIAAFNEIGYDASTFGNHEFDWGQTVLGDRVTQANQKFLAANLVTKTGADCTTAGWTAPAFVDAPYIIKTLTDGVNSVDVGIIGVTSIETPYITIAAATAGLCFKDPADSIVHYYDEMKTAGADVIVVVSHLGNVDGGYGYGFPVYGDQTLATKLNTAGKPVNLIIGGHSHTNLSSAQTVGTTKVVQAYYNGRKVGKADFSYDTVSGVATINWTSVSVPTSTASPTDPAMDTLMATYTGDPAYQAKINQFIGYTNIPLTPDYNSESTLSNMVQDAVYGQMNLAPETAVDMVFNNAGGIRGSGISGATYPFTVTYGSTFNVLPFGNQTIRGDMTGGAIEELLNQSATLFKGALQVSGIKYKFYRYQKAHPVGGATTIWAWGAFDIMVWNKTSLAWEPLEINKTYKVATNEFLAPAGQDGYAAFKKMTNISYHGDMLDQVNAWFNAHYNTLGTAYNAAMDGRIVRDGDDTTGSIIPLTVLHQNDSHGRLLQSGSSTPGLTNIAAAIKAERQLNPDRTLLLHGGDNIQGDAMMYYFRTAPSGLAANGDVLPSSLITHPFMAAMNYLKYDAMTLGNHEYNFGSTVFKGIFKQAQFPVLQSNVTDTGAYGIAESNIQPYTTKTVGTEGIKVAILGIGNHRVPNYELPSNIPGLSFTNPITKAKELAPDLKANNDVVIALTHIGFTTDPKSVEVDSNVDTNLAAQVDGIDAIVGAHSHTSPAPGTASFNPPAPYLWLPTFVGSPNNTPVVISQANRYNDTLSEIILGLRAKAGGGYEVVARSGKYIAITTAAYPQDAGLKAIIDPYQTYFAAYNTQTVGQTTAPIDTMTAFTAETNGANMQADASLYELGTHGITPDFHLSGAMTNKLVASSATPATPVTLTIADLFSAMPYENSLLTLRLNGPQLKRILERAYRNYFYYKYVPGYGGYSYYTTCMLDTNAGANIRYSDTYPAYPDGNNVISLTFNGKSVNFADADTYYLVSTVNYLAAGSCNFNDGGKTLWPLDQIVNDTQYYVRDAVIDYMKHMGTVSPAVEGRLTFTAPTNTASVPYTGAVLTYVGTNGEDISFSIPNKTFTGPVTIAYTKLDKPTYGYFNFAGDSFNLVAYGADGKPITTLARPITVFIEYKDADIAGLDENSLMLRYWNGTEWVDASCDGVYTRVPGINYFSVNICHLSRFTVTGAKMYFMPFVQK
jgi:2',3'-cyclic-nucleotide 2'-phosphodiesterase (5'-nucleotidase family)